MQYIYQLISDNPKYFAWSFGVVNFLWLAFLHFNKQAHSQELERLKSTLQLEKEERIPQLKELVEVEGVIGEAREILNCYKNREQKIELYVPIGKQLERYNGRWGKFPRLSVLLRNFRNRCEILLQEDPDELSKGEMNGFYSDLLEEINAVKNTIKS